MSPFAGRRPQVTGGTRSRRGRIVAKGPTQHLANVGLGQGVVEDDPAGNLVSQIGPTKPPPAVKPPAQPTNTGPYFIDPVTHQPVLKPGFTKKADGTIIATATGKPPKPVKITGAVRA